MDSDDSSATVGLDGASGVSEAGSAGFLSSAGIPLRSAARDCQ